MPQITNISKITLNFITTYNDLIIFIKKINLKLKLAQTAVLGKRSVEVLNTKSQKKIGYHI